ncbi:MAG: aquaporin [Mycobacterium sp.]|nr:aquaporin [Mycobacterium sp.]
MTAPTMLHRLAAEFIGTFWLVLGGCGSAVFAAKFPSDGTALGIGPRCSTGIRPDRPDGCVRLRHHLWRSLQPGGDTGRGHCQAGRVEGVARLVDHAGDRRHRGRRGDLRDRIRQARLERRGKHGGQRLRGSLARRLLVGGGPGHGDRADGGVPAGHPRRHRRSGAKGVCGLAIGLTLTLIHLISIPISNTSVNPARSAAVAFFNGDGAPAQLWLFWVAPLVGAAIAGAAYPILFGRNEELADRPVRDDALEEEVN